MKPIKILFLAFILLLTSKISFSQTLSAKLSGRVTNQSKNPIDGATVSLINAKDSTLITTVITDSKGNFSVDQIGKGEYKIFISYIGFEKYRSDIIIVDAQHVDITLPLIVLYQTGKVLNEVSIIGRKSFIENKIDRTVVNISGNPAAAGSNALDALNIAPGVLVSPDGSSISLNGKAGVMVYIDDKPTYLNGADLSNYLRSLPGSMLDKVELIPNPPAKYDAAGDAGIIIIRLKKNKDAGFNGSLNLNYGQGVYSRTSESLNFNYHKDKLNIFGSLSNATTKKRLTSDLTYQYDNPDGSVNSTLLTNSVNVNNNKSTNARLGFDYSASKNTTFGMLVNGIINPIRNDNAITNTILTSGVGLDSSIIASNFSNNRKKNGIVNLNFDHKFDTTGTSLTVNLDYVTYHSTNHQTFTNDIYDAQQDPSGQELLLSNQPAAIDIYSAKVDFTHPFKHGKLDAGVKTSFSNTDNAAAYFNVINGQSIPDYSKTNEFLYKENINAAYINYNQSFKRFEVQAGLRAENTNATGHQLGNAVLRDSSFKRNFTNLFPTLFLSYKLDSAGTNQLVFTYGRRIRRPYYQDLNPFLFFIDKFTYDAGNPYLKSQFSTNLELIYRYKDIISFKVFYGRSNDFFYKTTERDGDVFINRPANIGRYEIRGINLNANIPVTKWYNLSLISQFLNDGYKGSLYQNVIDTNVYAFDIMARNQFTLKNGWGLQAIAFYRSKRLEIQNLVHPFYFLDLGASKKILGNKGTITLYVKDPLHVLKLDQTIKNVTQAQVNSHQLFDTTVGTLLFAYNFGSSKNAKKRQDGNGADSEKQRIKDQ